MVSRFATLRWAALAASTAAVAALAACATSITPGGPGSNWPAERTFLSTAVTENGVPKVLAEGTRISLSFHEDGRISANAGCNHLGGHASLNGGTLGIDGLSMTEMGCDSPLMEQDQWLAGFLTSDPTFALDGERLTLTSGTTVLELVDREVADPDRPLAGTEWIIDTIFTGDSASNIAHTTPAVLVIQPGGSFEATTGCAGGAVSGTAVAAFPRVTFTMTAQRPCTDGGNALDTAIRAALDGERTYEITARSLRLLAPNGDGIGAHARQ